MNDITDAERIRAECESLGLEFRNTLDFYREWEMRVALRALRKLIPMVVASDDPDLPRDFDILLRVVGNHWKPAHADQDRRIKSGRRSVDTALEQDARDTLIRETAARIAAEKGTRRGIAGIVKNRLKLELSERQIATIIKKPEITS